MNKRHLLMLVGVLLLSLSLVGIALGADNPPDPNGSRSGVPDDTPPVAYVSPASFSEGFNDVAGLVDWFIINHSNPLGLIDWFQGNAEVFPAHAGDPTAYIAANFNSTSDVGTISDWLLTPTQPLETGATFSFWTRTVAGSAYPDRLQVRLSLVGASTNVGVGAEDVGDFTTLLLDINPTLAVGGYPDVWTQFTLNLAGIPPGSTGRFAFRYYVTDGGPGGMNSNYIGVDTVEYTFISNPEIHVSPLSLHSTQPPNKINVRELQICNTGDANLTWTLSESPDIPSILLIDFTGTLTSLQRALHELGYPFDYFIGDDWTGIDFSPYDVVIAALDEGLVDQASILKVRTDVIDAGKHLIFFGGLAYENFVMGVNQYLLLVNTSNFNWVISNTPHFTIVDPAHPLAASLPSPYNFVDSNAAYYTLRVTDPNIQVVADNGDGVHSFFYKSTNFPLMDGHSPQVTGDFTWFINSPAAAYWANPADYALLKQLLKNTLDNSRESDLSGAVAGYTIGSMPLGPSMVDPSLEASVDRTASSTEVMLRPPTGERPTGGIVDGTQSDLAAPAIGTAPTTAPGLKGSAGSSGFGDPEAVLWDNGPLVTHPAVCGGMDASRLQTALGMTVLGFGHQKSADNHVTDDFTIPGPASWTIDQITFFAYQTSAPMTPSPFTGVYYQIWDGPPNVGGSQIIYGYLENNRLLSSTLLNIQRDSDTSPCANNRYIFANVAAAGVTLLPGTYWIEWMTDGDLAYSGPWAPPITILGQTTTGNALQYIGSSGTWNPVVDVGPQGFPFVIEGALFNLTWLTENPASGTVAPGVCSTVAVTFNSAGLPYGSEYFGALRVTSNDPDDPVLSVPVSLDVSNYIRYLPMLHKDY